MNVSEKGTEFIAAYEGFVDHAYKPVEAEEHWTIGYGHYGPDVKPGQKITKAAALKLLKSDLNKFDDGVEKLVKTHLNQSQFDALVSFAYNTGLGGLGGSTLLKKVNARDFTGASQEFGKWINGASGPLEGLRRRRRDEAKMFMSGDSRFVGYTESEIRWIREYDQLKREDRDPDRRRVLRRVMTEQRKRIWHEARKDGKNGWSQKHRAERYKSLKSRTS